MSCYDENVLKILGGISMTDHKKALQNYSRSLGRLSREIPNTMKGFNQLGQAALADGAVSVKNKELIALGIGIASRCEGCIQAHVSKAIEAGATKEEMYETIGVAILMSGGPGTVYGALAYDIIEEFLG